MTIAKLSPQAHTVIDSYEHIKIGKKTINCPYFNNRTSNLRGALRVCVGKGTAQEISDEARIIGLREKIDLDDLSESDVVKFLTDHRLGLDCAALAYYILDAELQTTKKKTLRSILSFKSRSFLRRVIAIFRTIENTNVLILKENSTTILLQNLIPGDMIIALGGGIQHDYNHVLIVTSTTRDNKENLAALEYVHAYHWKKEGKYTKGIRRGIIEITKPDKSILDQQWIENEKKGEDNETWTYLKSAEHVDLARIKN